jgi:predicted AAA+ superfamily ATPase
LLTQRGLTESLAGRFEILHLPHWSAAEMREAFGWSLDSYRAEGAYWGRRVESAVGAHLANAALLGVGELFYWRSGSREVDFVFKTRGRITAIEVKSGAPRDTHSGFSAFADAFGGVRPLRVGGDGIPLDQFLLRPVEHWLEG